MIRIINELDPHPTNNTCRCEVVYYDDKGKIIFNSSAEFEQVSFYKIRILAKLWDLIDNHRISYKMATLLLADIEGYKSA